MIKNTGEGIEQPTEMDLVVSKINPEILENKKWLSNVEGEIRRGYCKVNLPKLQIDEKDEEPIYEKDVEVRIYFPNTDEDALVSEAYNKKYNELLFDDGHKTWEEILKALDKRGIWTESDEKEYKDYPNTITRMAEEVVMAEKSKVYLNKKITKKGVEKLKETYYNKANELLEKGNKRYIYFVNSIESLANVHSIHIQAVKCVKREKDKEWVPVWDEKSLGCDYSFNGNIFKFLMQKAVIFWRGQPQELLTEPPEEIQGDNTEKISKDK